MSGTGETGETGSEARPRQNPWIKLTIEMGPLILFFLVNGIYGIFAATGAFMAAIAASFIASRHFHGHIPPMLWFTGFVVMTFGGLTLYLADETFIKLKPTIINGVFAAVLFFGLARGRSYLKLVMEAAFPPLDNEGWMKLARNWALFFTAMAIVNEIVWRNFSTDFWVSFKLFGFVPLTFLFALSQMPVMIRHQTGSNGRGESGGDDDAP